jgi:hypothetical protein
MKMTFQEIRIIATGTCIANPEQYQNQINGEQIDTLNTHIGSRLLSDTASSASFLDLYLEFDDSGQLSTKIYDTKVKVQKDKQRSTKKYTYD